jgi:hypothetical protein
MAITPAAMQTALGLNPNDPRVIRCDETQGVLTTKQEWYVVAGVVSAGRSRWVVTTASDDAATQAAAVVAALAA